MDSGLRGNDRGRGCRWARFAAALALIAAGPAAATPLIIHYNERPPQHYTQHGKPQGEAIAKVTAALKTAGIAYGMRGTPAKQQLVLLKENKAPACMLAWVDLPGRERHGKFSAVLYKDQPKGSERRLWCTLATPDETMQRLNAALIK
ncbi:hypothetical protein [Duganella callida]|uniref:hypothetical protein n=1 Tax=Duganella callida TaxID=2561932 RepID=UPI001E5BB8C0|nr:hypothetical protein [Duganella callida]